MTVSPKTSYQSFCEQLDHIPIFAQARWLDAVCGVKNWNVCIYKKGGQIVGAWPYFTQTKLGQSLLIMPPLTKFLGVYIKYPENLKATSSGSFEKEVINGLLEQLPYTHIQQNFHYTFKNWLPLYWKGFTQTTNYSYQINENDVDIAFSNLKSSVRRDIKKAKEQLEVKESDDIDLLLDLVNKTFTNKNKAVAFEKQLYAIDRACINQKKLLIAQDETGNIHSAIYLVWDAQSYYYLLSGTNPDFKGSNANSLLLWHGIEEAIKTGKTFDFEGSMIEPIERFFRSFGAVQTPYFNLTHTSTPWLKTYFTLKQLRN